MVDNLLKASNCQPTFEDWYIWVKRWSQFSVQDYLRGSFDQIKQKLQEYDKRHPEDVKKLWTDEMDAQLSSLKDLLPWSSDAITAFQAHSYSPGIDTSLSELLRDSIGQWWEDPMHTFQGGMRSLPRAFMELGDKGYAKVNLKDDTRFGATVWKVTYDDSGVRVFYANNATIGPLPNVNYPEDQFINGDVAIVTLPLNIIRQVTFDPPLKTSISNSIADVSYGPSTKIMLQCRKKFWENDPDRITGGFSFTDLPISQLHYPTKLPGDKPDDRGILMVYTWKQEALLFGSESKQTAIQVAVDEVKKIHPQIEEYFEVGGVQAWYDDPCAQGAFCMLKPYQIRNITHQLLYPTGNNPPNQIPQLYFAGEAISYCNGWIQGALESGLRAAYQFYARNEESGNEEARNKEARNEQASAEQTSSKKLCCSML